MGFFSKFFLILALLIGFAGFAKADPITIPSGTAIYNLGAGFNLTGSDSTKNTGTAIGGNLLPTSTYQPGTAFTLITQLFSQTGSVNGAPNDFRGIFTNSSGVTVPVIYSGFTGSPNFSSLIFTSEIGALPAMASGTLSLQVPFTMQGILRPIGDCTASPTICNQLFNSQEVAGNGTATYTFEQNSNGSYTLNSRSFEFQNTAPTPEPATMILLGTGLAGIFGYAKRKRRKNQTV